jgi:hypothetical protein
MTYPVFASGDVLNASDMNAVGLWLVKTQTIGTGVSSVIVSDCFTTDYENYKIVISGGTQTSANGLLTMQLRTGGTTSATLYFNTFIYSPFTGGVLTANTNNGTGWAYIASALGNVGWSCSIDVLQPRIATYTSIIGGNSRGDLGGTVQGYHGVTTAYESAVFTVGAGTMTGGTIKVYGYRN